MLTSVIFVILTGLSMFFYPGGTKFDRTAMHYNFLYNFFSDLGATTTYSGKLNTISNILFTTALGGTGIVLIYFSKIWRAVSTDSHEFRLIGFLSKFFLIVCGISFVGIAFTPWNKFFDYHNIFMKIAFSCMFGWSILITILELRNPKMHRVAVANIFYNIILMIYLYMLFFIYDFGMEEGIEFQAVAQKIIIYFSVVILFIQALSIKNFLRSADFRKSGIKNFYV